MLLLIGIILSILEVKDGLKGNIIRILFFVIFIVSITIIYIFKDQIPSAMTMITKFKELVYDKN